MATPEIDTDYDWLKSHLQLTGKLQGRANLARQVADELTGRIERRQLPYTLGVFGGWGTGKTTLLAMIADQLESSGTCRLVYFNSWKYAGFMEIVPALIYKIMQYGLAGEKRQQDEAAMRILLALGKKYSDQIGDWAQTKIGINPSELFKDVFAVAKKKMAGVPPAAPDVVRAYYTQVDKAQDALRDALGSVSQPPAAVKPIVVLIDELDRCDPDEAFNVVKQMRVLFGMRDLPIAFVLCANPDPIGLAIKHRYGLESETGDYESRRILEKFVDSYQDIGTAVPLYPIVEALWERLPVPWMVAADRANGSPDFNMDQVRNATALDAFTSSVPQFANLRVLKKSLDYVDAITSNRDFLWTQWLLEVCAQVDPPLRRELRVLAPVLQDSVQAAYRQMESVAMTVSSTKGRSKVSFPTGEADKGQTLFAVFRSLFWDKTKERLATLHEAAHPQAAVQYRGLEVLLTDPLKVDLVILMSLLPFTTAGNFPPSSRSGHRLNLSFGEELSELCVILGFELAR